MARCAAGALARAHAKATDEPECITGYFGARDAFDEAMVEFAAAYTAQNAADYTLLLAAIANGRLPA